MYSLPNIVTVRLLLPPIIVGMSAILRNAKSLVFVVFIATRVLASTEVIVLAAFFGGLISSPRLVVMGRFLLLLGGMLVSVSTFI